MSYLRMGLAKQTKAVEKQHKLVHTTGYSLGERLDAKSKDLLKVAVWRYKSKLR